MKKHIYFVTTNEGKFEEVNKWCKELDPNIILEQAALDIPEIQSLDVEEVAIAKAKDAWKKLKKPLLIDDGGIYLEKYSLFPGTLSKYVYQSIGLDGVLTLAGENRNASFINCLVFINSQDNYKIFLGKTKGKLIQLNEPIRNKNLPFTQIFMPEGSDITLAQLKGTEEEKKYHYRYNSLKEFINWINN